MNYMLIHSFICSGY